MKKFVILIGFALLMGCDSKESGTVTDGASQSEIEQYRQMVEESQQAMAEGAEEAAKFDKSGGGG